MILRFGRDLIFGDIWFLNFEVINRGKIGRF